MMPRAIALFWRGLELWLITGPLFASFGALLAKVLHRRQGAWFLLGYVFNVAAVLYLIFLWLRQRPWQVDNPDYENPE